MKKTQDANKKIAKQAAENKSMESPWRLAMKRLSRNKLAIAGLIFLGVMIVLCIVGPIVSPYSDITATDIANAKQPPSASTGLEQTKMDEMSLPVFFMEDVFP